MISSIPPEPEGGKTEQLSILCPETVANAQPVDVYMYIYLHAGKFISSKLSPHIFIIFMRHSGQFWSATFHIGGPHTSLRGLVVGGGGAQSRTGWATTTHQLPLQSLKHTVGQQSKLGSTQQSYFGESIWVGQFVNI